MWGYGLGWGDLNTRRGGGATDNININKQGGPNKRLEGSENSSQSKVATHYHELWGLLWLNPGAQREHLISHLPWAAA